MIGAMVGEFSNPAERIPKNLFFLPSLFGINDMLQLTASAGSGDRAHRNNSIRSRLAHLENFPVPHSPSARHNFHQDGFSRYGIRTQHDLPLPTGKAHSAGDQFLNSTHKGGAWL